MQRCGRRRSRFRRTHNWKKAEARAAEAARRLVLQKLHLQGSSKARTVLHIIPFLRHFLSPLLRFSLGDVLAATSSATAPTAARMVAVMELEVRGGGGGDGALVSVRCFYNPIVGSGTYVICAGAYGHLTWVVTV